MIAQSLERIHRSNLIGMGVVPLQFYKGDSAQSLGLTGHERFTISGLEVVNNGELPKELTVTATADDDSVTEFRVIVRIDTPMEAEYYRHGGILQYVLRQMAGWLGGRSAGRAVSGQSDETAHDAVAGAADVRHVGLAQEDAGREVRTPVRHQAGRHLHVELQAVGAVAEPEGLVLVGGVARQAHGALR